MHANYSTTSRVGDHHTSSGSVVSYSWERANTSSAFVHPTFSTVKYEHFPNITVSMSWPNASHILDFNAVLIHNASAAIEHPIEPLLVLVIEDYTLGHRLTMKQGWPTIIWSGLAFPPIAMVSPKFYTATGGFQAGTITTFSREHQFLHATFVAPTQTQLLIAAVVPAWVCHHTCKTCQAQGEFGCVRCFPGNGFDGGRCSACVLGSTYNSNPGDFEKCLSVTSCSSSFELVVRCWLLHSVLLSSPSHSQLCAAWIGADPDR